RRDDGGAFPRPCRWIIRAVVSREAVVRPRGFILCLAGFLVAFPLVAQSARLGMVVLNLRFDGADANVLEPGDTAVVRAATSRLLSPMHASDGVADDDSATVAAAVTAAEAD